MPQVEVDGLRINYDVQGNGEPLLLIPYTSADHACYAFQLPSYAEHFSCIALDLPGSGESDKPAGPYSTEGYADQVAGFLGAVGVDEAHVAGVSLGAAVGIHLAARHPGRVRSLSLHSGWHASDDYLKIVVEQWRTLATALPTTADVVIQGIFPWCFSRRCMSSGRSSLTRSLTSYAVAPRSPWTRSSLRSTGWSPTTRARCSVTSTFRP
jgi:pimeloyl-ACP methyl ester carboxylesterase